MKKPKNVYLLIVVLVIVFFISLSILLLGGVIGPKLDDVAVRTSALVVAFASFGSSALFSLMIYLHNKTIFKISEDQNKRQEIFKFSPLEYEKATDTYILYNEKTKRHSLIVNLVFNHDSSFFKKNIQNEFSKLKLNLIITNMLDVKVKAESELFF